MRLSPRQTEIMLKRMPKYAGQLLTLIPEDRLLKAMRYHRWVSVEAVP